MTTTDAPGGGAAGTKEQAQDTSAAAAREEGQRVAGMAKEQASEVATEAAAQARNVVSDAVSQVSDQMREQGGTQRDRLVATLTTLGDDLSTMADQTSPGLATDLTRQIADQARSLTSRLDGREVGDLLDDLRNFARQRPGVFLLGSLVAGVVAGRLLAGTRDGIAGAEATKSLSTPSEPAAPALPPSSLADDGVTFTRNPTISDTAYGDGLSSSGGRP